MNNLLQINNIRKTFPGVVALDEVSLSIAPGEIHTLLGENGAGKSTLMNVLTGLYRPDRGEIFFDGEPVTFSSPRESLAMGIGMVHQHFMLVPAHSVFENILLALDGVPNFYVRRTYRQQVQQVLDKFNLDIDLDTPVWKLSIGAQQWIELIKLLVRDCRLLILDEPTAVLTPQESARLFAVLTQLRDQGKSILFISHKMREVMEISDRVTVLKKGRSLVTLERGEYDENRLASLMIGEDQIPGWQKSFRTSQELALEIKNLSVRNDRGLADLDNFTMKLHRGQILGIAGVAGNGQKALAEVLTGLKEANRGTDPGRRSGYHQQFGARLLHRRHRPYPGRPQDDRHRPGHDGRRQPDHEKFQLAGFPALDLSGSRRDPPQCGGQDRAVLRSRPARPATRCAISPAATSRRSSSPGSFRRIPACWSPSTRPAASISAAPNTCTR